MRASIALNQWPAVDIEEGRIAYIVTMPFSTTPTYTEERWRTLLILHSSTGSPRQPSIGRMT